MKRKINKRLFSTATLAILVTVLLTVAVCYNLLKKQILDDLRIYAKSMVYYLETDSDRGTEGDDIRQKIVSCEEELAEDDIRITVIAADGSAAYDSAVPAEKLSNHKNRPEVKDAFVAGE